MRLRLLLLAVLMTADTRESGYARSTAEPPDMIIRNARLIDGTGAVIEDAVVAICDGRIQSIKQTPAYEDEPEWDWEDVPGRLWTVPGGFRTPEATVIDAGGKTVMPGLIDTHVRFLDGAMITGETTLHRYMEQGLPEKLDAFLAYGVTTVRSAGDPEDAILLIRERIRTGELSGPRLHVVGPALNVPGIGGCTAAALFRSGGWLAAHAAQTLNGIEEALETVRRLSAKGVDGIHLDLCSPDPVSASLLATPYYQDMLRRIVAEAHARGLPATACTVDEQAALCAVSLGIDGVAHGVTRSRIKDRTLEKRLGLERVAYAPALGVYAARFPEHAGRAMDNLRKLAESETVEIVLGSDTSGEATPGLSTIQEMKWMVQAGLTPAQVIRASTRDAAGHLRRLSELGTVTPGKYADLIMVRNDPLLDIDALDDLVLVMKGGKIVVDRR